MTGIFVTLSASTIGYVDASELEAMWGMHVIMLEEREHFNELAMDVDLVESTYAYAHETRDESLLFVLSWYSVRFADRDLEQVRQAAHEIHRIVTSRADTDGGCGYGYDEYGEDRPRDWEPVAGPKGG